LTALMLAMLKLGFTAFGGPVAAIAMMRQEFVIKRQWLSENEILASLQNPNTLVDPWRWRHWSAKDSHWLIKKVIKHHKGVDY